MKWTAAIAVLMAAPLGQPPLRLQDEGVTVGQVDTLNCVGTGIACTRTGARGTLTVAGGGAGGAPTTATYITQTPDATLSAEQALSANATGLMLSTTATGVVSTYAGTSCAYAVKTLDASGASTCTAAPTIPTDLSGEPFITKTASANLSAEFAMSSLGTGLYKNTTGTGVPSIYAGTSCTNQFPRSLDASAAATCASVADTDFTGQLALTHGGTNANLTASNGAVPYSDASKFVLLAPGTSGQVLTSGGAGAPTWGGVWQFLGTATGATTTVGPITWTAVVRQIQCWYQIAGYNGATPVGRFLIGTASISTTARTNSYAISEGVTAPTTASGATATPGIPLAVTLSAVGRAGTITVDGASGAVKVINVLGQNQTPAVATVPTIFQGASFFSDLGTNLAITRAQLTVYDSLTATAASAQTFLTGTYLACWGRNTN